MATDTTTTTDETVEDKETTTEAKETEIDFSNPDVAKAAYEKAIAEAAKQKAYSRSNENKAREYKEGYEQFKAYEDSKRTDEEKHQAILEELETLRADKQKRDLELARNEIVKEVAESKELPENLVATLSGNTKEELEKAADVALQFFSAKEPSKSGFGRNPLQGKGNSKTEPIGTLAEVANLFSKNN